MEYVTKSCPHCKYKYSIMTPKNHKIYGCPIITCERCGKQYFDKDYEEPGIYIEGANYPNKGGFWECISIIIGIIFIAFDYYGSSISPVGYILGALFVIGSLYILYDKRKNYQKDLLNAKIAYQESLNRLSNKEYVVFLQNNGVRIPNKFLQ